MPFWTFFLMKRNYELSGEAFENVKPNKKVLKIT